MDGLTVMTGQNTERSLDINLNGHPSESMTGPWFMFTPTSPVSYLEISTMGQQLHRFSQNLEGMVLRIRSAHLSTQNHRIRFHRFIDIHKD